MDWIRELNLYGNQLTDLEPLRELKNLTELYLGNNQLTDLAPLRELKNLTTLWLSSNQLTDLEPLRELKNLTELWLSSNRLTDLEPLRELKNLTELRLSRNQLTDLEPLRELKNLTELWLSDNQLTDLEPLRGLEKLTILDLDNNQLTDLEPLRELKNLTALDLDNNQLTDLAPLRGLKNLTELLVNGNQLTDLEPLRELKNLTALLVNGNQLTDLEPLRELKNLTELYLRNNQLTNLEPLRGLEKLTILSLIYNRLTDLEPLRGLILKGIPVEEKYNLSRYKQIAIGGNPLTNPPMDIVRQGPQAVREYFLNQKAAATDPAAIRPLNEAKLILIGDGEAGKTSLLRRWLDGHFDPKEPQTDGIRIRREPLDCLGTRIKAYCWDFGGQEIMHASHRFFLTERSLYVVVVDSRNKEEQADFWLRHIENYGKNAPVLVVINKTDINPGFKLDEARLQRKYPNICGFWRVSCAEGTGIEAFDQAVRQQLHDLELRKTPFGSDWLAVRDDLLDDRHRRDFITLADFQAVCARHRVTRPDAQTTLLGVLHCLGIMLHFEGLQRFDTQVLNPRWLTNAVYRIVTSKRVAAQGGFFKENELADILADPPDAPDDQRFYFPPAKFPFILQVMQTFELCFATDEEEKNFVVPDLLPARSAKDVSPFADDQPDMLRFEVRYPDFFPPSVMPRLMVRLHPLIHAQQHWRTAMVLREQERFSAEAFIESDAADKKIYFQVTGDGRRNFLSHIRNTLAEINAPFLEVQKIEELVLFRGEYPLVYDDLLAYEAANEPVFIPALRQKIPVEDILGPVEEPIMRAPETKTEVTVFVSYSHEHHRMLEEMKQHFSLLTQNNHITIWDDGYLRPGDTWDFKIKNKLAEADMVIFLLSAPFFESTYIREVEIDGAFRQKKVVFPIRLHEVKYDGLHWIAEKQCPVNLWVGDLGKSRRNKVWSEIADKLLVEAKKNQTREVGAARPVPRPGNCW
jgi:internalin A